ETQLRRGEDALVDEPAVQRGRHDDRRTLPGQQPTRRAFERPRGFFRAAPTGIPEVPSQAKVDGRGDEVNYNVGHPRILHLTMLDTLTSRLANIAKRIRGEARLSEANIQDALREVRVALLEADVALPVVKHFIDSVRAKALGEEVVGSLTPGQALVGVVHRELAALHAALKPVETLFIVDAMQGQDAANVAKAFNERLPLTGVILTKLDGDSRGGAALSVRHVTGKPIKFAGVGEKLTGLEPFHPERMAARILGMGDILSLVEEAHARIDLEQAKRVAEKVKKG